MPKRRRARAKTPTAVAAIGTPASPATTAAVGRVRTPGDAERLAGRLLDPARSTPVVVVTIPSGNEEPWIDVAELADAVLGLAEVAVMPTDASSWRLSELMPPGTQVFGGAGRVYPPGLEWTTDLSRSPLRFAYSAADRERATNALISDALSMAPRAQPRAEDPPLPVSGTVSMLVPPSRALVSLDGDGLGIVWQELTMPGVPIADLLQVGQRVTGLLDRASHRVDVTQMCRPAVEPGPYRAGDVVLARVEEVRPDVVHLALLPSTVVAVPKHRVTSNPADAMTDLFSPGETVVARIAWEYGDRLVLRLDDVDDDEVPLPAPSLLDGGPPWLQPPQIPAPADEEASRRVDSMPSGQGAAPEIAVEGDARPGGHPTPLDLAAGRIAHSPAPRPAGGADVEALAAQLQDTRRQAEAYRMRAESLEERNRSLEAKVREQKTALRSEKLRRQATRPRGWDAGSQASGQFEFEVFLAWRSRFPAHERPSRPLADYSLGPEFLASLDALDGIDRRKVVDVVVEVLTGLARDLDGRELHRLRSSATGGSAPVTRADGWKAWRVALQRYTPAARRLHYWQHGEQYELSRVVSHDDFRA